MTDALPTIAERFEKSSQIESAVYHADKRELCAVFKSSAACVYAYQDVPPEVWSQLLGAPSVGSFFHHEVKIRGYLFTKHTDDEALSKQRREFLAVLVGPYAGNAIADMVEGVKPGGAAAAPPQDEDDSSDIVEDVIEGAAVVEGLASLIGDGDSGTTDTGSDINAGGGDFGGAGATGDFSDQG